MSFTTQFGSPDSTPEFDYDEALIESTGSALRLLDLGGGTYSEANPAIDTQHQVPVTAFVSFNPSGNSIPGGTNIKYQFIINGSPYWRNVAEGRWEASDGTYDQANPINDITNLSDIFADLSLVGAVWVRFRVFLHSDAGTARPTFASISMEYRCELITPTVPDECLVTCYLRDLLGNTPTYDSEHPAKLYVRNDRCFFHGTLLVQPFSKSAAFDSDGYAELSIIETESVGEYLTWFVTIWDGRNWKSVYMINAVCPTTAARSLSELTTTRDSDPG